MIGVSGAHRCSDKARITCPDIEFARSSEQSSGQTRSPSKWPELCQSTGRSPWLRSPMTARANRAGYPRRLGRVWLGGDRLHRDTPAGPRVPGKALGSRKGYIRQLWAAQGSPRDGPWRLYTPQTHVFPSQTHILMDEKDCRTSRESRSAVLG